MTVLTPKQQAKLALIGLQENCHIDAETKCWHWRGYMSPRDLPTVRYKGKHQPARRLAVELAKGPVDKKARVVLSGHCDCDCINPAHAKVLTPEEFLAWNRERREMYGAAPLAARVASIRKRSKVGTVEKAESLRARVAAGEDRGLLAEEAGISRKHLNRIACGDSWAPVQKFSSASVFSWRPA